LSGRLFSERIVLTLSIDAAAAAPSRHASEKNICHEEVTNGSRVQMSIRGLTWRASRANAIKLLFSLFFEEEVLFTSAKFGLGLRRKRF
jgi:hypothetical protein